VFIKYRSGQGECARKYKPRKHSSVHKKVRNLIKSWCSAGIQRQGYVVFGEFFLENNLQKRAYRTVCCFSSYKETAV
jgi:hypothetical protein